MKTVQELIEKYRQTNSGIDEILDFYYSDLLTFIDYNHAKQFLKDTVTREEWQQHYKPLTKNNVIEEMRSYMKFAWSKCCDERGLSSMRNLAHYRAWLWILEDYEALKFINLIGHYACYGAPCLKHICDKYGWNYLDFIEPYDVATAKMFITGFGCQ